VLFLIERNLNLAMKKFILIIILLFSFFVQLVHGNSNGLGENLSVQNIGDDELSFESNDNFNFLLGILPSTPVYFNIVPEDPVTYSYNSKSREFVRLLIHSRTKNTSDLSFYQYSFFSRYCSVFQQIYLRTACFRL
jgi:hypothetical protein